MEHKWNLGNVSILLQYSCGVNRIVGERKELRTYPSPGALYPNEVFVVVNRVNGLRRGLYVYDFHSHSLVLLNRDITKALASFMEPKLIARTKLIVVLVANPFRTILKYGDVGYKFALLEAGLISENLVLVATALGKSVLPYESYLDDSLNEALGMDGVTKFVTTTLLFG